MSSDSPKSTPNLSSFSSERSTALEQASHLNTQDGYTPDSDKALDFSSASEQFDALVNLLGEPFQEEIQRLNDDEMLVERLKEALPEAILRRGSTDPVLAQIFAPIVQQGIERATKADPEALAEKLMPSIRIGIRRTVNDMLSSVVESLSRTLDHSLNISWRLEALRTSTPFAQVVLAKTLEYRVEHVYLIHRESGLLLHQVSIPDVNNDDGDMISAMLTAIGDFVHDSFKVSESENLNTIKVGDLSVIVEQGKDIVVAAVVRGVLPADLDENLADAISIIQMQFKKDLSDFKGDSSLFSASEATLSACLRANFAKPSKGSYTIIWGILATLFFAFITMGVFELSSRQRWTNYLQALQEEPGIVVTEQRRAWGRFYVEGLRDAMAIDPSSLITTYKLPKKRVSERWENYQALEPTLILRRAERSLAPPASVQLSFEQGILSIKGSASQAWQERALLLASSLAGVEAVNSSELSNSDVQRLMSLVSSIEQSAFYFDVGSAGLSAGQENTMVTLERNLATLRRLAVQLGYNIEVEIRAHAELSANEAVEKELSQKRAERLLQVLALDTYNMNYYDFRYTIVPLATDISTIPSSVNPELARRSAYFIVRWDKPL